MSKTETRSGLRSLFDISLVKFLLIGGTSTLIDYIIYSALSLRLPPTVAKLCSMLCSTFFAFLVNRKWTFDSRGQSWIESLKKYYLAQAANITVNVSTNAVLLFLTQNKTAAFIGATAIAMSVNFLLQKFYVFKKKP